MKRLKLALKRLFCKTDVSGSCESKNVTVEQTTTTINGREIKIYTIDSCEYIGKITGGNADVLSHKGNCKFCAERSKK